jgi:hypothetical protein
MQQLLTIELDKGGLRRSQEAELRNCVLLGSSFTRQYWYQHKGLEWFEVNGKPEAHQIVHWDCPVVSPIPLQMMLPDTKALNADVQRWNGIGYRLSLSLDQIRDMFASGEYTLNKTEFDERLADGGSINRFSDDSDLLDKDELVTPSDKRRFLEAWIWYGKAPHKKYGLTEVRLTILTEVGTDDPSAGLLVKLLYGSELPDGIRPFACSHWNPMNGALGGGVLDQNEDLLKIISQLQCMLVDNLRITCLPINVTNAMSGIMEQINGRGGLVTPGATYESDPSVPASEALVPINLGTGNSQLLFQALQYFLQQWERRTITDSFMGSASKENTATEATIMQRQSQRPIMTRATWYAQDLLEPAITQCLMFIQRNRKDNQQILIRNSSGVEVPAIITPEEISQGKYRCFITMTHQDSMKQARAQTLKDLLPIFQNLEPNFQARGADVDYAEISMRILELSEIQNPERIVRVIGPPEQALKQQLQQLQQQLMQTQEQLQKAQQQGEKRPSESISFKDLPPDGQIQMAAQAGIQLDPQLLMMLQMQQQAAQMQSTGPEGPGPGPEDQGPPPSGMMGGGGGMMPSPSDMPMAENGGPMGEVPDDANINAQMLQEIARQNQGGMP